jgi:CHAD domain-containing protein
MRTLTFDGGGTDLSATVAVLTAAEVRLGPAGRRTRTRFDTFDGRLHAAGLRLERRTGGADELVLTGPDGVPARLELGGPATTGVPPAAATAPGATPSSEALRVDALPPGPFRSRLAAVVRARTLLPHLTLTSDQQEGSRPGREGAPTVAVRIDRWRTLEVGPYATRRRPSGPTDDATPALAADGRAIAAWTVEGWTVEVTPLPGHPKPAEALRCQLEQGGLRALEGDALDLAGRRAGLEPGGWQGPARTALDRRAPALVGYRTVLRDLLASLEANWQGTIEHLDSEFLHQARIAIRRTRSVLTEGRGVLPAEVRRAQRETFAWFGGLTGPARDLDVYVEGWPALTAPLGEDEARSLDPVRDHLVAQRALEHAQVSDALRSERTTALLAVWRDWLARPDDDVPGGRRADRPLGEVAAGRLAEAQEQVIRDGRAIGANSPPEALHELRKDAKRLRYLLESFGPLGGRKRLADILGHLKLLQDNLGEFQDTQVQADRLRTSAAEVAAVGTLPPATAAAIERLTAILEARGAVAREDFARCFADYDARRTRRTVTALIDRMSR